MNKTKGLILALAISACGPKDPVQLLPDGFELHPDFDMTLVASEPLVTDPVLLEYDAEGRAFLLEMPGYPYGDQPSSIHRLIDSDGDGTFDKKTLFADSLRTASTFMVYGDAILVAAAPDLLLLRDTDGDDKADQRERLITGFVDGNQQHNVNGLIYTLDNCIYLANGYNGGSVHWVDDPDNPVDMTGYDLKIDLVNHVLELLGKTSGGHEIALDDYGRIFHTHNTRYLQHLVFPKYYLSSDMTDPTHTLDNIGQYEANGLGRIFPLGEQVSRLNHPEQAGYFSGSCGVFHYGGHTFPSNFHGDVFIPDVVLNLIHRNDLVESESSFKGKRIREGVEFLASRDRSFRPVTLNTGPDGAMYVLDMNRLVIEHPEWIPDQIENDLDLTDGMDRGRIYRIAPREMAQDPFTAFQSLQTAPIQFISHPNQWVRMMAQQQILLGDRDSEDVATKLKHLLNSGKTSDLEKTHALWILSAFDQLDQQILLDEFAPAQKGLLENLLKISERFIAGNPDSSGDLQSAIIKLSSHDDHRVAMQAILTSSTFDQWIDQDQENALAQNIASNFTRAEDDPYLGLAIQCLNPTIKSQVLIQSNQQKSLDVSNLRSNLILQCLSENELVKSRDLLKVLASDSHNHATVLKALFAWQSDASFSKSAKRAAVMSYLKLASAGDDLGMMVEEVRLRKSLNIPLRTEHKELATRALKKVLDATEPSHNRRAYLQLLHLNDGLSQQMVQDLLQPLIPVDLQENTLEVLAEETPEYTPEVLISNWTSLGPTSRKVAGDILLYHSDFQSNLLDAFESGKITLGEMNMHLERRRELLFSKDKDIRDRAQLLFDDSGIRTREEVVTNMQPALDLSGLSADGLQVYEKLCAQCHIKGDHGVEVGPDLGASYHKSKMALLHDILDPNSGCETGYLAHEIDTKDGKHFVGIITQEQPDYIVIVQQGGHERRILRSDISKFEVSGRSLMPEGLETSMSHQDMADLLAFLQEV